MYREDVINWTSTTQLVSGFVEKQEVAMHSGASRPGSDTPLTTRLGVWRLQQEPTSCASDEGEMHPAE
jgi:hypothetical protein